MPSKFVSVFIAVLVTYAATTLFTSAPSPAVFGQTVDSGDHLIVATGKLQNIEADALYIVNEKTMHMGVYLVRPGQLELHSVRDFGLDFQLGAYGEQTPTTEKVKEALAVKKRNKTKKTGN